MYQNIARPLLGDAQKQQVTCRVSVVQFSRRELVHFLDGLAQNTLHVNESHRGNPLHDNIWISRTPFTDRD